MTIGRVRRTTHAPALAAISFALLFVVTSSSTETAARPTEVADGPTEVASVATGRRWAPGVHYEVLQPSGDRAIIGKVEVLEFFYFGCPHCYKLEASLASWMKSKPAYIVFKRVPATWMAPAKAHARLFYALKILEREDLYQEVFATLHERRGSLYRKNEQEMRKLLLGFAGAHGISATSFFGAYESLTVATDMERAEQLARRYRVAAVPVMVINSKYKTSLSQAGGIPDDLFALVSDLAAREQPRQSR